MCSTRKGNLSTNVTWKKGNQIQITRERSEKKNEYRLIDLYHQLEESERRRKPPRTQLKSKRRNGRHENITGKSQNTRKRKS